MFSNCLADEILESSNHQDYGPAAQATHNLYLAWNIRIRRVRVCLFQAAKRLGQCNSASKLSKSLTGHLRISV